MVVWPVTDGGVTSTVQVIVFDVAAELPHASVAVNVLVCVRVHPVPAIEPSTAVTVGVPQLSVAVALPNAALISAVLGLQGAGVCVTVIVGGVASTVLVSCCVTVLKLPHTSVTLYVLILVSVQPDKLGVLSLTKVTVGVLQLSASSVTTAGSAAGNDPLQTVRLMEAGLLAVGATLSVTVITWVKLLVFPQASFATQVLV
jgi:hypothetical protein